MRGALTAIAVAACGASPAEPQVGPAAAPPGAPPGCRVVGPDAPLQATLDAPDATSICLAPGRYAGPIRIARALTLWGPRAAVVYSATPGTTIAVTGAGAAILGVTVDGTGGRFDYADAAIKVTADDVRVEGIAVDHAMFGIVVESSRRVRIAGNTVHGGTDPAVGMRGDTIRLWETDNSEVVDNFAEDGRDAVIWYSRGNHVARNRIERARYGFHLMYSSDNTLERNRIVDSVVGVFVMYSRGVLIDDNAITGGSGAGSMAIGLKESGNVTLTNNRLVRDAIGIYVDSSPLQITDTLTVARNQLALDERAMVFHSGGHRVAITDNDFIDNRAQVEIEGGGDAQDVAWHGNYFDDYAGYDLDDDGHGDVPYEARSLASELVARNPQAAILTGTPALALVDAAAHLDPLFAPRPLFADPAPRMEARLR